MLTLSKTLDGFQISAQGIHGREAKWNLEPTGVVNSYILCREDQKPNMRGYKVLDIPNVGDWWLNDGWKFEEWINA